MSKRFLPALGICAIFFQIIAEPAYAQISGFRITASDGDSLDNFGQSVSISGDYAVVGAFGDDDSGNGSGSAYVFKRTGTSWTEEAKLLPSDGAAFFRFGWSASISGEYAVVGASADMDNGVFSGSAYVFKRTGTSWAEEAKLLPADGAEGDEFGISVSISGDYAVVGAFGDDDSGNGSGSAYVFKRTGASWVQEAKLLPSDGAEGDHFGRSVSISGDYVIAGALNHDDNGAQAGSAYVFKRTGASWVQEAKLLPSDGAEGDHFGSSVSIFGDYAVVGAFLDDDNGAQAGSAYVFKRIGTSWAEEAKLLSSDGAVLDLFGSSVSISDDYAVVGAWANDDNGENSGSAYVFKRTGTNWTEEAKFLAPNGAPFDEFGRSISISGDYAIVGAGLDDDNGTDAGSAYLYSGFATPVGVEDEIPGLPAEFALSQNYPNPFNPVTVIEFALPQSGEVSLVVYNLMGQAVMRWDLQGQPAGIHSVSWDATNFASGIYIYRLQAGDFVQTRKMILLK